MGAKSSGSDLGPARARLEGRVSVDGRRPARAREGLSNSAASDDAGTAERAFADPGDGPAGGRLEEAGRSNRIEWARSVSRLPTRCRALDAGCGWIRFVVPL